MARTKRKKERAAAAMAKAQSVKKPSKAKKQKASPEQKAAERHAKQLAKDERRATKLDRRRKEKRLITREMWADPAPSDLDGRLSKPAHKSKYHSYFEFAENTEKKDKKLEFQVTNDPTPPPGFKFVPIGYPTLTNACKEISRVKDAMIFFVSGSKDKEEDMRISAHISRIGYHFRESIVDEASERLGDAAVVDIVYNPKDVEPIPESQDEINTQADAAIRDLFPRIPHTDRTMVIDHAFKKGALFHGEATVGLQATIPLSRRVQLAVLAHIRHTHTRYDQLLRETTWMNARKVVEPICLDFIVKWRGDEETGRDQMDEILREVVVLTDSEDSEDSSEEEDSSDEEVELTSASSASISQPSSRTQNRPVNTQSESLSMLPAGTRDNDRAEISRQRKAQRGFKRYQAAWNDALTRQQDEPRVSEAGHVRSLKHAHLSSGPQRGGASPYQSAYMSGQATSSSSNQPYGFSREQPRHDNNRRIIPRQEFGYLQQQGQNLITSSPRDEVMFKPTSERPAVHQSASCHGAPVYSSRDQGQPIWVRDSPPRHKLQDLLVPSIETASSDAMNDFARIERRYEALASPQEPYPRRVVEGPVDYRRRSPDPRQVIIINDDSPQNKRQRVVYEDDQGRTRPLPSRKQHLYNARADSQLLPASSAQSSDFLVPREKLPSQNSQRVYGGMEPSLVGPVPGLQIPIYTTPPGSSTSASLHGGYRRAEGYANYQGNYSVQRMEVSQRYSSNDRESAWRPVNGNMASFESNQGPHTLESRDHVQRALPAFHPSSADLRALSHARPRDGHQAFLSNLSEARLDCPLPRAENKSTSAPERVRGSIGQVNHHPRYEDQSSASFMTLRPGEAGSPVRYVERPTILQESRNPASYAADHPTAGRQRITEMPLRHGFARRPPEKESPTYVRPVRRPIIVLD